MEREVKYCVLQKHHFSILKSVNKRLVKAVTELVATLLRCRRSKRSAENTKMAKENNYLFDIIFRMFVLDLEQLL